ncbi:MAG UNVERIFIED_CONTAM: hypothetical protein LVT10_22905 [Anaerolineae bacterium]
MLDVDFRPHQWHDVRAFGVQNRAVLPLVDVVIGTEDEINAAMLMDTTKMNLTHSQVSDTKAAGIARPAIMRDGDAIHPHQRRSKRLARKGQRFTCPTGRIIHAPWLPGGGLQHLRCGARLRRGFLIWLRQRLGLAEVGSAWVNACGAIVVTQARSCQLHAHDGRSADIRRPLWWLSIRLD